MLFARANDDELIEMIYCICYGTVIIMSCLIVWAIPLNDCIASDFVKLYDSSSRLNLLQNVNGEINFRNICIIPFRL